MLVLCRLCLFDLKDLLQVRAAIWPCNMRPKGHACAAAGALAARGKVERLAHGEQRDVTVALHRMRRCAPHLELAQGAPIVCHLPGHLCTQQACPSEFCA